MAPRWFAPAIGNARSSDCVPLYTGVSSEMPSSSNPWRTSAICGFCHSVYRTSCNTAIARAGDMRACKPRTGRRVDVPSPFDSCSCASAQGVPVRTCSHRCRCLFLLRPPKGTTWASSEFESTSSSALLVETPQKTTMKKSPELGQLGSRRMDCTGSVVP